GSPARDLQTTRSMLTVWEGNANGARFRIDDAYEVSESFTQFLPSRWGGDHNLKFGAQYIYSQIELPDQTDMNGRFTFSTDKAFNASDPTTYPERLQIRVPVPSDILMPTQVVVFFAQDQWRAGNLTANIGGRYDLEMTPINNSANPLFQSGQYAVDRNNVAPRIGLTWNPRGTGKSIVRGGYGIFYDKVTLQTTTPF